MTEDPWEHHAEWWQAGFTEGADPEYVEQIIPLADRHLGRAARILDIGTGEGQLARHLAGGSTQVVGIDASQSQLSAALQKGGGPAYSMADATKLPFPDRAFDAVLVCLVLEHVLALDAAVSEMARVLVDGGRLLLMLNHPLFQTPGSGWIDDRLLGEQYWRVGPYLSETDTVEEVEKGVFIRFFHRPLHRYLNSLAENGILATHVAEPSPPPGFLALAPEYAEAATIPRLFLIRGEKLNPRPVRAEWSRNG